MRDLPPVNLPHRTPKASNGISPSLRQSRYPYESKLCHKGHKISRFFIENDFVISRIIIKCWGDRIISKVFRKLVDGGRRHPGITNGDFVESLHVIDETLSTIFLLIKKNRLRYGPYESSRVSFTKFSLTIAVAASCIGFRRRRFCCLHGEWEIVWITTGGSISGCRRPISESPNAIVPSCSNRISIKSRFSAGDKKLVPIFIFARHSEVRHDPRGTVVPDDCLGDSEWFTPPPGLMPSGKGTFAGNIFLFFHLYIVLIYATYFTNYCFVIISWNWSFIVLITIALIWTFEGPGSWSNSVSRVARSGGL